MTILLALLSGAAGLIYEVAWARRLAQLCGGSALAQTLTLAAFLGGLAAGGVWLARRAGSGAAALRFYSRLEWLVCALGLAAPLFLSLLDRLDAGWPAAAGIFLHAFVMGGAVPALCGALGGEAQRGVGRIYAANSAGAVVGALGAGVALIPAVGLDGAFVCAAALNALAALGARLAASSSGAAEPEPRPGPPSPVSPTLAHVALFASGFVALTYEIAWTRLLALTLGSSAYSFAEMLAAMIAGVSVGSALAATPALRRRDPGLVLALAELGAGACVLATLPLYESLPLAFTTLQSGFQRTTEAFYVLEAMKFLLCLGLLLPPTACLGLALPAAARLCAGSGHGRSEEVGLLLASNTAGNVLGAFAGLWLLPWLGMEGLLRSGTTVHLLVGAAVGVSVWPLNGRSRRVYAALAVAAVVAWRLWLPRWDPRGLGQGFYRAKVDTKNIAKMFEVMAADLAVLYYKDDREATVMVARYTNGPIALKVNGKTDASTGPDMATQVLLGHVPLLLHPGARRALVVGWGSGVTAGSMLAYPLETLDAVELIPAVVEASRVFDGVNRGARSDPRLNLRVEDARAFLRRPGPAYDVIVSEPSNPWMAGVGDLFSREFYARARARLAPGGLMVQWIHTYEMDDPTLRLALRTFGDVFPHVTLWNAQDNDLLVVGSDGPLPLDWRALERRYRREEVWQDLHRISVLYPATLLSLQRGGDAAVRAYAGSGTLNTERRPRLEYSAPLAMFRNDQALPSRAAEDRLDPDRRKDLLLQRYLAARRHSLRQGELMDIVGHPRGQAQVPVIVSYLDEWMRLYPRDPRPGRVRAELVQ